MVLVLSFENNVSIVALPERLDGTNSIEAEKELAVVLDAGLPVIIDASRCNYTSSAGLRLLMVTAKRMIPSGCPVVIASMAENLVDVMRITGFDHIFTFSSSVSKAVELTQTRLGHAKS